MPDDPDATEPDRFDGNRFFSNRRHIWTPEFCMTRLGTVASDELAKIATICFSQERDSRKN
jgi:hypothetical protein